MNSTLRSVSIEKEATPSDFRNAMRQLTGGVSVITAGRGRDISGMTVTSVSSHELWPRSVYPKKAGSAIPRWPSTLSLRSRPGRSQATP